MIKTGTTATILIVDDTIENLNLLSQILTERGYKVRASKTGYEAIASVLAELPDLILLDIKLPDISGFEVCTILKANERSSVVPIIFISALHETEDKLRGFDAGGVDYITKPFNSTEVEVRIKTHLEISRLHLGLEQRNQELVKLNAEKDKFFSIIAHDLKDPFLGLLGLTGLLVEDLNKFTPDELAEVIKELNLTTENLYKLLENLLEWAMIQKGAIICTPKDSVLSIIVSQSIEAIYQRALQKRITIKNEICELQKVCADEKMIKTVLRNLLSNAVKFTKCGGQVTILSDVSDNKIVKVSVMDTGIGIKAEDIPRLFKIEEKVSTKGTDGELSTGLGLLLCKEFVEKNGGRIWVESEEGNGSTFNFTLAEVI